VDDVFALLQPSSTVADYANQCLIQSFPDSGLALQDAVNEVGARLGAEVTPGRYRGTTKDLGHDGLWTFPSKHSIVVEVKTTDAYRIDLGTIARYRRSLIESGIVNEAASSMLLVVGRQDTGDLEAQIRGSRHAWDIRIISVGALLRLMSTKEEVEDPQIVQRIHSILIPREFTRLDEIADILFSAAEDIKQDVIPPDEAIQSTAPVSKGPKFIPVAFHDACIARVQPVLGKNLVKRSRAKYSSPDKSVAVSCAVSKEHDPEGHPNYWFAFHPHQREFLREAASSYVVLGCGSSKRVLLIPFPTFDSWLDGMWVTEAPGGSFWHIVIHRAGDDYELRRRKGEDNIELGEYLLPETAEVRP
jgi:hypothetical protein